MALPPLPCPPALLPSCPCPLLFFSHCFFSSSNLTFVVSTAQLFFSLDLQQFDFKLSMLKKPLPPERHPAVMHSGCVSRLISPLKSPSQKKSAADCSPYCWWLCYCMPFISLTKINVLSKRWSLQLKQSVEVTPDQKKQIQEISFLFIILMLDNAGQNCGWSCCSLWHTSYRRTTRIKT